MQFFKSINAFACDANCRDNFKGDRKAGLNYGLFRYSTGEFALNREEASRNCFFCVYCGTDAKLEIHANSWIEVSPEVFRSWTGQRRMNGKPYKGKVYVYLTQKEFKGGLPRETNPQEKMFAND